MPRTLREKAIQILADGMLKLIIQVCSQPGEQSKPPTALASDPDVKRESRS
jgi:hypothetical protein